MVGMHGLSAVELMDKKLSFPMTFMDQLLDQVSEHDNTVSWMVILRIIKSQLQWKIKRKLLSLVPMVHSLYKGCLLSCVMPQRHFNVLVLYVCLYGRIFHGSLHGWHLICGLFFWNIFFPLLEGSSKMYGNQFIPKFGEESLYC